VHVGRRAIGIGPESLAQLAEKGCHVGADPLFGEETIFDAWATSLSALEVRVTSVAQLERDHKTLARALFAPMPATEFDCFASGLAEVIASLREHLATTAAKSRLTGP